MHKVPPLFSLRSCLVPLLVGAITAGAQQKPVDSEATPTPQVKATPKPKNRPPKNIKLTMRDGLRFDPPRFAAQPGDDLIVEIENADSTHQLHNFLLLQPGKLQEVVQQAMALGDKGASVGFIPQNPAIIIHSALLEPDKIQTVKFKAPKSPGVYPYVCSFPGHGMIMYGALYVGTTMPPIAKDPNIPPTANQPVIPGGGQRPYTQRIFMPDSGPASIAVALPGEQNVCWDAGACRLRYVWRGAFIESGAQWKGSGKDLPVLPDKPWWVAAADGGVGFGGKPTVKFLGYSLRGGLPEFNYRVDGVEVFEKITAGKDGAVELALRIPEAKKAVTFRIGDGWKSTVGSWNGADLKLTPEEARNVTLTLNSTPSAK